MRSLKIVEFVSSFNQRSTLGRVVVNPPSETALYEVHSVGNINICCGRAFLSDESLKNHLSLTDNHFDDLWNVQLQKKTPAISPRQQLKRVVTKPSRFKNDSHADRRTENKNEKNEMKQKRKLCKLCGLVTSEGNYNRHLRTSHGSKNEFKCRWCCCRLATQNAAFAHSRRVHPEEHKNFCWNKAVKNEHVISARKMKAFHTSTKQNHLVLDNKEDVKEEKNLVVDKNLKEQLAEIFRTTKSKDKHTCIICGKVVGNRITFKHHLMIHTGDRPYKCTLCSDKFRYTASLNRHLRRVHSKKLTFKCNKCKDRAFFTQKSLRAHNNTVHRVSYVLLMRKKLQQRIKNKSKPSTVTSSENVLKLDAIRIANGYKCRICGKVLSSAHNYRGHLLIHANLRPEKCTKCSQTFRLRTTLNAHLKTYHVENGKFKCGKCVCSFAFYRLLCYHVKKHHMKKIAVRKKSLDKAGEFPKPDTKSSPAKRKECFKNSTTHHRIKKRNFSGKSYDKVNEVPKMDNKSSPLKVKDSVKNSTADQDIKERKLIVSGKSNDKVDEVPKPDKKSSPVKLNKSFKKSTKNHHIKKRGASGKNLENANEVPKVDKRSSPLKVQEFLKNSTKSVFAANTIGSSFESSSPKDNKFPKKPAVTPIKKVQLSNGLYKCHICAKLLSSSDGLRRHKVIHINSLPHKCPKCPVRFRHSQNIRAHLMTSHSAEGKFPCPKCPCKLKSMGSVKLHIRTYHKEPNNEERPMAVAGTSHNESPTKVKSPAIKSKTLKKGSIDETIQKVALGSFSDVPTKIVLHHCRICEKGFLSKHVFKQHQMNHPQYYPYECQFCSAKFRRTGSLSAHIKRNHSSNGKWKCPRCSCKMLTWFGLRQHISRSHHKYFLSTIKKKVSASIVVKKRKRIISPAMKVENKPGQRKIDEMFQTISSRKGTSPTILKKEPEVQKKTFSKESTVKIVDPEMKKPILLRNKNMGKCRVCAKVVSLRNFSVHMMVHTNTFPFLCSRCPAKFRTNVRRQAHIKTHHIENGDYECPKCPCRFHSSTAVKIHLAKQHNPQPEKFNIIQPETPKKSEGSVHLKTTPSPIIFPRSPVIRLTARAKVRPIRFFNSSTPSPSTPPPVMTDPREDNTSPGKKKVGRKPADSSPSRLTCKTCKKVFVCPQSKRLHETVHTGIMEYQCDYCGKEFRLYSSLTLHIRKYESKMEGKFSCDKCTATCSTEESLNHHKAIHKYKKKSYNKNKTYSEN